jgi:hypothetical protein
MRLDCNFCDTPTDGFPSCDLLHTGGFLGILEISPVDVNRNEQSEAVRLPLGAECRTATKRFSIAHPLSLSIAEAPNQFLLFDFCPPESSILNGSGSLRIFI